MVVHCRAGKPPGTSAEFDQFEELFVAPQTNPTARARSESFLIELGDLIENRLPTRVREDLERDPALARRFDFHRRPAKVILSFREDYLAEVEGLRHRIPSLMHNRYRLNPMTGEQAYAVVTRPGGHLVDDEVARRIIGLAAGKVSEPPPATDWDAASLAVEACRMANRNLTRDEWRRRSTVPAGELGNPAEPR